MLRPPQRQESTLTGSTAVQYFEAVVIAATNRDLDTNIKTGSFREDLFVRLTRSTSSCHRSATGGETSPNSSLFSNYFARQHGRTQWQPEPDVFNRLVGHVWPGTVRQLAQKILPNLRVRGSDRRCPRHVLRFFARLRSSMTRRPRLQRRLTICRRSKAAASGTRRQSRSSSKTWGPGLCDCRRTAKLPAENGTSTGKAGVTTGFTSTSGSPSAVRRRGLPTVTYAH
jgi:transcriptional regulator with GAF, ATPase, and Fis domain